MKNSFLKNIAISNVSSTSVHLIKPPVSRIELLNVKFFPLFSKLGVLIMDLFYHCDQHVAHTVPFAVEVSTCCLCLVVGIDISSMFCKSIFKRSFRLPYILLGALLAPQQIYNVGGGAIYTTVDVSLVVIRCCFYSFPLLDIWTDTTPVASSHPWYSSFCSCIVLRGDFGSNELIFDIRWPLVGHQRGHRKNLFQSGILCHCSPVSFQYSRYRWQSGIKLNGNEWSLWQIFFGYFF